jgi:TonB family protein
VGFRLAPATSRIVVDGGGEVMSKMLVVALAAALQLSSSFHPARITSGSYGEVPYGARAAGVVVLEADVDEQGTVRKVTTVKDVEPFGPALASAVEGWRFEPARMDGRAVAHPVLVAGLYRPAMVMFPAPPPPPAPPSGSPTSIPYPTEIGVPPYPADRIGGAAVLVSVSIDDQGAVTDAQVVGESTGFDSAALDAARRWVFRPAQYDGRDVASNAYLVFVFREPA